MPIEQQFDGAALSVALADGLTPVDVGGGVSIVGVVARLDCRDYQYTLHPAGSARESAGTAAAGAGEGRARGKCKGEEGGSPSVAVRPTEAGGGVKRQGQWIGKCHGAIYTKIPIFTCDSVLDIICSGCECLRSDA